MRTITRREAMKNALRAGTYAAPVILASRHVAAAPALVSGRTITFTPAPGSPFAAGTNPYGVAMADFNGDGKLDLAITNYGSNDVTVLLGTGNGGFRAALGSPVAVGVNPFGIAVGDFNGDNKPDLAVTNFGSGTVNVLLGTGSGTFTNAPGSPFAVGVSPISIAVGDFNGDGGADLAVTSYDGNSVSVLLGTGNGGFTTAPGSPVAVGRGPIGIAVGDINGDGYVDLAVTNFHDNTVSVLLQQ